ncbi:MAG: LysR family transcriptional regulator [Rhodospirillales bacterium]|nr:LysR family transcriptional regulator [Rhodospirillales bacterium]
MNMRDLETFLAVAAAGSVGGAARVLHLTQPAVTRRVQNLERELGTLLLCRETKPLRPTADGETVIAAGRRIVEAVEDMRASVAANGEPTGQLRLGMAQAVGDLGLGKPLGRLRQSYPRLALRLESGWTGELLGKVANGTLDAAAVLLRAGDELPFGVAGEGLATEEVVVVAAAAAPTPMSPATLDDLAPFAWVLNPEGCGYRRTIRRALERRHKSLTVAVDIIGPDTQLSAVAEGVGLGLVPRRVLEASRFRPRLRAVALTDFTFSVTIWVVAARALGRLTAPVSIFRKALADVLATDHCAPLSSAPGD